MFYFWFILKIVMAALLGGLLGWQREKIGKVAGPRTYALVAIGSTLFTFLSLNAFGSNNPAQVAAQIITGIGFLGAGMILKKEGGVVEGLTTAAGLWAVSAVGMAIGAGWYIPAILVTIVLFIVLSFDDSKLQVDKDKKM